MSPRSAPSRAGSGRSAAAPTRTGRAKTGATATSGGAHPAGGQAANQKVRLDLALVSRGLAPTREKAARLILAGAVTVDGQRVDKAGALVTGRMVVAVAAGPRFVSRGGDKLVHALAEFRVAPAGRVCVDVGASTGGFTHCLLEAGAAKVYAVDVGQNQLDATLRADGRVAVMDRTNARNLSPLAFAELPNLATVDVSFISLEKVLPPVIGVLGRAGEALVLAKPQFEVGKGEVGKGGVVRDPAQHRAVLMRLARFAILRGWHVLGVSPSPITGAKGNREFFLHLGTVGRTVADISERIEAVVQTPVPPPA